MDKLTISRYLKQVEVTPKTKNEYKKRYQEVQDKITLKWFYVTSLNHIVVHARIPSEKVNLFYDVLIEFPFGKAEGTFRNFRTDKIRVYSNCPSFVYMNARLFEKKGFLISWAKQLYSNSTFEEPPKDGQTTEPEKPQDVRYEKSLYFTALYLDEMNAVTILQSIATATAVPRAEAIVQYMKSPEKMMATRTKKEEAKRGRERLLKVGKNLIPNVEKSKPQTKVGKVASVQRSKSINKIKHI